MKEANALKSMGSISELDALIEKFEQHQIEGLEDVETIFDALLDESLLNKKIRDIDLRVAALLRLVAVDYDALYGSRNRKEALDQIRERLEETSPSVLKKLTIDRKTQADEVCRRIARIVPDAKKELDQRITAYDGVDNLSNFRNRLLRTFNGEYVRATIHPFLDIDVDPMNELQRCLGAAVDYSTADASEAGLALEHAIDSITALASRLLEFPTSYSQYLAKFLDSLHTDLQKHFDQGPFSKPARLKIGAIRRRFPFHVPQLDLAIPMLLENKGGIAIGVEIEAIDATGLDINQTSLRISDLAPGNMTIELNGVTNPTEIEGGLLQVSITWINANGTEGQVEETVYLEPQDPNINWELLSDIDPYSLNPVSTEEQLIGRVSLLDRVTRVLTSAGSGSLCIYGQKRVGKTSLARVALERVERRSKAICIFRDIGSINDPDPTRAIDKLTRRLIEELDNRLRLPKELREYDPDGSLAPLVELVERTASPERPIIIALDEFDRLPVPLLSRTPEGDAFFTALRSISSIEGVGMVLIGGERMKIINSGIGVELNKFETIQVDYLDGSTHWSEFVDLVRKPGEQYLEFTDEACAEIYGTTAGNPYYTKQLCAKVLDLAFERRDAFVDAREVVLAQKALLRSIGTTSFAHYWEDFLLDQGTKRDEKTLNRRRCLLALGLTWAAGVPATLDNAVVEALQTGLDQGTLREELREFATREILIENDSVWSARVALFRQWLSEYGQQQIVVTASELESARSLVDERKSLAISIVEADELAEQYKAYSTSTISGERIREYLQQFGGVKEQRLMFQFLDSLTYFSPADEIALLQEAFEIITQRVRTRDGEWNKNRMAVFALGVRGKSASIKARSFAKANQFVPIDVKDVNDFDDLVARGVTDIIATDDFIGTGETLIRDITTVLDKIPSSISLHVVTLAGMGEGYDAVSRYLSDCALERVSIDCMREIPNSPGPFDVEGGIYDTPDDAREAFKIVENVGREIEPRAPLGYGGCCAPVVFSDGIPNNAPAILWKQSKGARAFSPLFRRNP